MCGAHRCFYDSFYRCLIGLLLCFSAQAQTPTYFPPSNTSWETIQAQDAGFNPQKLEKAVSFALQNEYSGEKDLRIAILKSFAQEPFHELVGPVKERGEPAGMILKNGRLVTKWGNTKRVDMTFSVTKSYLSTVAGLAVDAGLISSINDEVREYVWDGTFDGEHNQKITWEHLLTQSSDWSGDLFGMKDWADRPPRNGGLDDWKRRDFNEPGTIFEYNDVRVNVLAYALLQVWRQPLPSVLKEHIMDPIGASTTWRWFGYEQSWILVDGQKMQSVTGGGHSGGGLFINTEDHARFGLLFANHGKWKEDQLVSSDWIKAIKEPSNAFESYGYMWWLNRGPRAWEGLDNHLYYAAGFGGNFIVIDEKRGIVVVTRWLEPAKIGEFMKLVYDAVE